MNTISLPKLLISGTLHNSLRKSLTAENNKNVSFLYAFKSVEGCKTMSARPFNWVFLLIKTNHVSIESLVK